MGPAGFSDIGLLSCCILVALHSDIGLLSCCILVALYINIGLLSCCMLVVALYIGRESRIHVAYCRSLVRRQKYLEYTKNY